MSAGVDAAVHVEPASGQGTERPPEKIRKLLDKHAAAFERMSEYLAEVEKWRALRASLSYPLEGLSAEDKTTLEVEATAWHEWALEKLARWLRREKQLNPGRATRDDIDRAFQEIEEQEVFLCEVKARGACAGDILTPRDR